MKILILFTLSLFFVTVSFAQNNSFYYGNYDYPYEGGNDPFNLQLRSKLKLNKVSSMEEFQLNIKKNKPAILVKKIIYDTAGNSLAYLKFNKKGKVKYRAEYVYNNKYQVTKVTNFNKKGKIDYSYEYLYKDSNKLADRIFYNSKGEVAWKYEYIYEGNKIKEYRFYGKKNVLKKRYIYDYYDSVNLKSITLYNKKGKIEKVWSYECNQEGQQVAKTKDTTKVCKLTDYDYLGYKTVTYIYTDEKGKKTRMVSKYKDDSIFVSSKTFDSKDRLTFENSNEQREDTTYQTSKRYVRGKLRYEWESKINKDRNLCSSAYYRKGKIFSGSLYVYNDKKLLSEIQFFDKKNNFLNKKEYNYTYFN